MPSVRSTTRVCRLLVGGGRLPRGKSPVVRIASWLDARRMNSRRLTALCRPLCADDATANRTPFGVDDIAFLFAHGQIVFLVWVTLSERKWVSLA